MSGPDRRDAGALGLIAETLAQAQRLSARGRAAYDEDEVLRLAAEALVSRLGEGASRLSEGFKASHPEVPWRQIIGARNIVAHEYHRIDAEMIWNSVSVAMPSLAAALGVELPDVPAQDSGAAGSTPPRRKGRRGREPAAKLGRGQLPDSDDIISL